MAVMKIPEDQPRYYPDGHHPCHQRAENVPPGKKVEVFPCGQRAKRFTATVVRVEETPQTNNQRVLAIVEGEEKTISLGGGTSVRCSEE